MAIKVSKAYYKSSDFARHIKQIVEILVFRTVYCLKTKVKYKHEIYPTTITLSSMRYLIKLTRTYTSFDRISYTSFTKYSLSLIFSKRFNTYIFVVNYLSRIFDAFEKRVHQISAQNEKN